jgi:hypothetical protein
MHLHSQVHSPKNTKGKSSALSELLPKLSKKSVAGQCLSLLNDEAKSTLENKMELAMTKTMRLELKNTCLLEAHGDKASTALREHLTACIEEVPTMRHATVVKSTVVICPTLDDKHYFPLTSFLTCNCSSPMKYVLETGWKLTRTTVSVYVPKAKREWLWSCHLTL